MEYSRYNEKKNLILFEKYICNLSFAMKTSCFWNSNYHIIDINKFLFKTVHGSCSTVNGYI